MLPGVDKTINNFLQHCLRGKGGLSSNFLEIHYKIYAYFVEWRVVDFLLEVMCWNQVDRNKLEHSATPEHRKMLTHHRISKK